jgi:hypothetical protein
MPHRRSKLRLCPLAAAVHAVLLGVAVLPQKTPTYERAMLRDWFVRRFCRATGPDQLSRVAPR